MSDKDYEDESVIQPASKERLSIDGHNMDTHELFDELCKEIFYGFNMRMVLLHLRDDDPEVVGALAFLLNKCRDGRDLARRCVNGEINMVGDAVGILSTKAIHAETERVESFSPVEDDDS